MSHLKIFRNKEENKKDNMVKRFTKSIQNIKSLLFLFLALILSVSVKSQNCQILDTAIVTNVPCYGDTTGSVALVMLNPLGSYTYLWLDGQTNDTAINLSAGTHHVQIIDNNNPTTCIQDTFFTITEPQDPLSSTINLLQDVPCFGDSTGAAFADVIGGTAPYTYLWSNGETAQTAVNLWAGPDTVIFTDFNGCVDTGYITINNQHSPITGVIEVIQNTSCFGVCDGIVELTSSGGQLQHTYFWNNGQTYTGSGTDTAFSLCYGGHSVVVEDNLGCRETVSFVISQPDELFASAVQVQPVQCYGFDDGMASAVATGGTTPYLYIWDDPINGITGSNISNLTPGIHTIYVTDSNGCAASDTVLITEPTQLEVVIIPDSTIYSYCAGTNSGQLCALATGGTPSYTYSWNDALNQTTECAFNIPAQNADYTIIVMDDRNCIASASFQLDSITNSMNLDSVTINPVSCWGIYDGSVEVVSVGGAVAPFTYAWTGPGTYTGTGNLISSLYSGNYSVVITDDNGCAIVEDTYVTEPDQLYYTTYNVVGQTCYGACDGQIWVDITGGTGNYYHDLSEIGTFPIPSASQVQLTNDSLILNLCEGTHTIYITDDNNCEAAVLWNGGTWIETVDTGVIVSQPQIDSLSTTSCFNLNDGYASVLNPDSLLTYTWEVDNGGSPSGIDISNGAGTSWGAFSAGDYWLVAHYADSASFGMPYYGCDNSIGFTILPGTSPIVDGGNEINVSCYSFNDGKIDLNITGGVSPYDLYWDTTSVYPNGVTVNNVTNYTLINLTVGTYAVSIVDSDSCVSIWDYHITEPSPLISEIKPIDVSCFGFTDGQAIVTPVSGSGTATYTYLWSTTPTQTNLTATGLAAGLYTCTVSDNQGCFYTDTVVISQPDNPIASVEIDSLYVGPYDVSCFGASDASAFVTGSGTSFVWTDALGNIVSTDQHTQPILSASSSLNPYTVTSTDLNGCVGSDVITITEPPLLIISVQESNPSSTYQITCNGADDGWAEVTINGGVENNNIYGYDISWENNIGEIILGDTIANNLAAGFTYTVTVSDANGCADNATTILYTQPIEFIPHVSFVNYSGPFHPPYDIIFVDSTVSNESYNYVWTLQNGAQDFSYSIVNSSDYQLFTWPFSDEDVGDNEISAIVTNNVTGCDSSVSFMIQVQGFEDLIIKNVFSPNGDDFNQEFSFSEYEMESVDVQIFNRWGQLVKSWVGSNKTWDGTGIDGKDLPEGVYFYVFVATGTDGYYYDKKGSITLLR